MGKILEKLRAIMKIGALLILMLIFAAAHTASACAPTENGTPVCAYWTRADAVFSGKALKVEDAPKNEGFPDGARKVRFQVQQNFKGVDNPTFTFVTLPGCGLNIKSGQSWIIYAANDIVVKSFSAFRGVKLEPKIISEEVGVLENIKSGKSDTAIAGRIASAAAFEPFEIVATGNGKVFNARSDASGAFNLPVAPDANYRVELKFPFRAGLKWADNLLNPSLVEGTPTLFKFDVRLSDGDCHFSSFEVIKKSD